jgi:serine/threonine protein kinase/Flp pilus assembly protein TadD
MKPGDRLGHYTIVSHLGSGGMGAVYRATDATLGRDVALKILPSEVAVDPDRLERFRREARAIAALNHPNIVTIYSVEQADGVHFLTMELVSGQPLDRLIGDTLLPVEQIMAISQALAEALAAAHGKGIVHRDLKPANVILNESGHVKVLDFGLAKVQSSAPGSSSDSATNLATSLGMVVGTPAYMSPEQVSGVMVDHRTDIFSLGALLYELATGVRPFRGRSPAELASSILRDEPRPASELRPSVPTPLARVIARCLEKDATTRYPTMSDVSKALKSGPAPAAAEKGPSVAVLPFQNLSADPENEFFSDGLAEEILNALSQVEGLRVAARTSSFTFKGRTTDVSEIGSKLHVSTVLDGSVRRSGNRIRVTVQLVDVANGFQLWSERYDREMADIFDVQDEIARAIAEKLKVTLTAGPGARLVKQATSNVEAYELCLRGRALLLKRGRHVLEGIECLRRAVDLDPEYAAAWSGLSDAYTVRGYWGMVPPGETMPKGLTAARRAVALDPELAEGHGALAMALLLWERDYPGALAEFHRCFELNPGYTQGRTWYGLFYLGWVTGRTTEAVAEVRRALETDPLSAYSTTTTAMALFCDGQTAEALELARRGVERDADSLLTHWVHAMAAQYEGHLDEAFAAFKRAEAVSGSHPYPIAHAVVACADHGKTAEARVEYARLLDLAARRFVPPTQLSLAAAAVGEIDKAIELAHQACDERDPALIIMARVFPDFRRVREDSRFPQILKRLNLPA